MYNIRNCSTIYIDSVNGVDRYQSGLLPVADGLGNGPVKTLEFAFRLVKNLRATGNERPIALSLVNDYYLTSPIVIPKEVNGITINSYGNRKRVIGGAKLEGWQRDTYRGVSCLSARLPDKYASLSISDLYVNGERASLTRYPASGKLTALMTEEQKTVYDENSIAGHSRWFIAKKEDLEGIEGIEDAIVNYYHFWIDEHSRVESFDKESMKITMSCASRLTLTTLYEQRAPGDMYYYLSNVASQFGKAGEWYLDRQSLKIYYVPRDMESVDTIEAFIPVCDSIFNISSRDVSLSNLEICVSNCDYESHKDCADFADTETGLPIEACQHYGSDEQSVCCAPGAISIEGGYRVTISDCFIHSLGIHAIAVEAGSHHVRIERCEIFDVAGGGIKIFGGKYGSDEKYHVNDCFISDNKIHDLGKRYEAGCGVLICHAHDNVIENNEIYNVGYSGISVGWVWGYAESETHGNLIRNNHIHHIGYGNLSDMGGIYLLGRQHGTVVSGNRIHNVSCENYGAWGIYLDEGSSSVVVENNVVFDTKRECFVIHYGSYNLIRNNIFVASPGQPTVHTGRNELCCDVLFERNIMVSLGADIYNQMCGHNTLASRRNFVFDAAREKTVMFTDRNGKKIELSEWQSVFGQDFDSVIVDPGFVSIEERDFTLREDSSVYALGFQKIPESATKPKSIK